MNNHYPEFKQLSADEINAIWEGAVIVLDTNILLNLYRYSENSQARYLYAMYHYNHHVREEGGQSTTFRLPCHIRAAFVKLLEQVQQCLLTKIERLHIAIECNPTSNYKIGEMERYDEHPILKF